MIFKCFMVIQAAVYRIKDQGLRLARPCLGEWSEYTEFVFAGLDVKTLSKVEKLRLIEALWADLAMDDASIASPRWHQDALHEAERLHSEGKATFSDWSVAKERIRADVSAR